jgi:hypothetical protein
VPLIFTDVATRPRFGAILLNLTRPPTALRYFLAGLQITRRTRLPYPRGGLSPRHPRLFAALFLLSAISILIYLLFDFLSHLLLRHWHERATEEDAG